MLVIKENGNQAIHFLYSLLFAGRTLVWRVNIHCFNLPIPLACNALSLMGAQLRLRLTAYALQCAHVWAREIEALPANGKTAKTKKGLSEFFLRPLSCGYNFPACTCIRQYAQDAAHHIIFQPRVNAVILATAHSDTILWVLWHPTDSLDNRHLL